jgi:hypothetical protein
LDLNGVGSIRLQVNSLADPNLNKSTSKLFGKKSAGSGSKLSLLGWVSFNNYASL